MCVDVCAVQLPGFNLLQFTDHPVRVMAYFPGTCFNLIPEDGCDEGCFESGPHTRRVMDAYHAITELGLDIGE